MPQVLTAAVVVAAVAGVTGSPAVTLDLPILVLSAVAVGVLAGAELIQRAVVARRKPVSEPALLAADDAMRTQSAHALAGAVIIAAGSLWSILLSSYGDELPDATARQTPATVLPAVAWLGGMVVQNLGWRVRRLLPAGPS